MDQTVVVGAGLSGLLLAGRIAKTSQKVIVLEKSKALGGRMATRRDENARYDHGAQFLKAVDGEIPSWAAGAQWWLSTPEASYLAFPGGMTSLAKSLAAGLEIEHNFLVGKLVADQGLWQVHSHDGAIVTASRVYLSCPLPQSLQILRQSQIDFSPKLEEIHYAKAVVGLFRIDTTDRPLFSDRLALDPTPAIAMIADQHSKNVSGVPAVTITMSPPWSEEHFEDDETTLLEMIRTEINSWIAQVERRGFFSPLGAQVKKWRYSHPLRNKSGQPPIGEFADLGRNLYLIGDAFGGGSLRGAARSAFAVPIEGC